MASFISFQRPPGAILQKYDATKTQDKQTQAIPEIFLDAMVVREKVYVGEQAIPLENEFDSLDAQSYHWVVYASVGAAAAPGPAVIEADTGVLTGGISGAGPHNDGHSNGYEHEDPNCRDARAGRRRDSLATKVPAGTIRLVPPPHEDDERVREAGKDKHDGERKVHGHLRRGAEPYVKLGRLAVTKPYRKMGLSRLLVSSAEEFASGKGAEIVPTMGPAEVERRKFYHTLKEGEGLRWEGLILVHAQVGVEKLWKRWGYVRDELLGVWDEEGIDHCGMWKRIKATYDPFLPQRG